jgi:DNA topoisomerase-1
MSTKKMFVVESPNKIQTLKKILGPDYIIVASVGHIRNIPAKGMNIDIANGFIPTFEISKGRKDVVANLKKVASNVDEIILATDLDREGEAIAFHVFDILPKRDQKKCCRVTYTEITKNAVQKALKEKRPIDQRIVDSQKARQVLDRLIGYTVSPLLWNNVQTRTSAGRVQSIALKIVSDREKEITSFKPTDFWYVDADLKAKGGDFVARVVTKDRDNRYLDKKVVEDEYKKLEKATFIVNKVNRKEKSVKANHPFDTSSLQTTASTIFSWPVKRTSQSAQKLYEKGVITYIRTDSYKISKEAVKAVRELITSNLGDSYLPDKQNVFKKAKGSIRVQTLLAMNKSSTS